MAGDATWVMRPLDLRDAALAREVWVMQQGAYAQEAALIDFWDIPPLVESLEALRASDEQFWGCFVAGELAGVVASERVGDEVEVTRMMVQATYARRGIGRALLAQVAQVHQDARRLLVATGTRNLPAVRLYEGFGFVEVSREEVAPEVWLTHFAMVLG